MTRRILAAVAALVIATVGALAALAYSRGADRRALAGQEAVRTYVAQKVVPAGTTAGEAVRDGLIATTLIARKAVPDDALGTVDGGYQELVATSTIQPGELVLRARFAARAATPGTLIVPDGMLATSVALDDPSHVGPFVTVGSTVAVFDTFNVAEADRGHVSPAGDHLQDRHEFTRATRLLLPDVEVLAVGATTTATLAASAGSSDPDGSKAAAAAGSNGALGTPASPTTTTLLTLAVTQAQAERLVHAARTGTLTFALLGPGTKATAGAGVTDRSLFEVTK